MFRKRISYVPQYFYARNVRHSRIIRVSSSPYASYCTINICSCSFLEQATMFSTVIPFTRSRFKPSFWSKLHSLDTSRICVHKCPEYVARNGFLKFLKLRNSLRKVKNGTEIFRPESILNVQKPPRLTFLLYWRKNPSISSRIAIDQRFTTTRIL